MSEPQGHLGAALRLSIVAVRGNGGGASRFARLYDHIPEGVRFVIVTPRRLCYSCSLNPAQLGYCPQGAW